MADKVFRFTTRDAASGEFREISVAAASKEEAEETIERQEQKKVAFVMGDPAEIAALEKRLKEGSLSGRDKAMLMAHRQDKPYKIEKGGKA